MLKYIRKTENIMDMKKIIVVILVLVTSMVSYAQYANTDTLLVYTKYTKKGVMIKIAPQLAQTWLLGAENGYLITRAELGSDKDAVLLTQKPLKPFTNEQYAKLENGDTIREFQHMAIYDNLAKNKSKMSIYDRVNFSTKLQNDYGFYYLLVSRIRDIGKTSGLEFIDRTAKKDRSYIYTVKIDGDNIKSHQSFSLINTVEEQILLPELISVVGDKSVDLSWIHNGGTDPVLCYYIEKSKDGRIFHRINSAPVYYQPESKYQLDDVVNTPKLIKRTDSLEMNYTPYYYRLVGVDIWAEEFISADIIRVEGVDKTPPPIVSEISSVDSIKSGSITFKWNYNPPADFAGFKLFVSNKLKGIYHLIDTNMFSANIREYTIIANNEGLPVYFRIAAFDTAGNYSMSQAEFAMLPDLLPPSTPTGFRASVDTNGILILQWNNNPENDIKGYHVLGSNTKRGRYIASTGLSIKDTIYIDTLNVNSLSSFKYFRLEAIDFSFNVSEQTQAITVRLPDVISPIAPSIVTIKAKEMGVEINWIPSFDKDVAQQQILRRKDINDTWEVIANISSKDTLFFDKPSEIGFYYYTIRAIDSNGNKSVLSLAFSVEVKGMKENISIVNFKVRKKNGTAVLSWKSEGVKPKFYLVYREDKENNIRIIASIRDLNFIDTQVDKGSSYRYYIVAQDEKGILYSPSKIERVSM